LHHRLVRGKSIAGICDEFANTYPRSAGHFKRLLAHSAFAPDLGDYLEKIERSSARIK